RPRCDRGKISRLGLPRTARPPLLGVEDARCVVAGDSRADRLPSFERRHRALSRRRARSHRPHHRSGQRELSPRIRYASDRACEHPVLRERVLFPGYVPDERLACLYSSAMAVVMPALTEGFGLPAIEAIACGVPVLASDVGAVPEVVGEAGLFFDPRSATSIA